MPGADPAYLVERRDDGFGDVFPISRRDRCTLGRAPTNRVVLKDDLCSREHAEVAFADGRWRLRDLNSLNGVRISGRRIDTEDVLAAGDEVQLGRSRFVFVEDLAQLPAPPASPLLPGEGVSIRKRLGQTRFLTPPPFTAPDPGDAHTSSTRRSLSRDLALLYRLALDMGSAATYEELVGVVLDGLLEAIPADVGAVLTLRDGDALELTAYRPRHPTAAGYQRVSEFLSREVFTSREAVLAEDVARHRHLGKRESLSDLGVTSVICAPVLFQDRVLGLIHLYSTDPHRSLDGEDLEFTVALAKQLGLAAHHLDRQARLTAQNRSLRDQLKVESELVGQSAAIKAVESQIGRVADTSATVLIRGESGVGKELVARAIHYSSPRREGPFVCLNCAALTETLLESELFGHEKGAFTGATEKKVGKFEAADSGTIFLDEIGEMTVGTQAKLLRILEGHPFERVGGSVPIKVNVRVVAATNQPLEEAVHAGRFRKDLFFRLQVVEIAVPPLRQRQEDVPLLADHFLHRFVAETGRKVRGFTAAALAKMQAYHWPGNVRELRNVIERAVALGSGPLLDAADIWLSSLEAAAALTPPPAPAPDAYEPTTLEDVEKLHILLTLRHTDWNKSRAADILRIERSTLDRKIKAYELKRDPAPG